MSQPLLRNLHAHRIQESYLQKLSNLTSIRMSLKAWLVGVLGVWSVCPQSKFGTMQENIESIVMFLLCI